MKDTRGEISHAQSQNELLRDMPGLLDLRDQMVSRGKGRREHLLPNLQLFQGLQRGKDEAGQGYQIQVIN